MGRFKGEYVYDPIIKWLLSNGFENDGGPCGEEGYNRIYSVDNKFYYVWVTFNFNNKKLYIYKEYNCGGCVGSCEVDIADEWMADVNVFIDKTDEILESWIG